MKTKSQVISEHSYYTGLINGVINRIGIDSVPDVNRLGASAGFAGFAYYTETVPFAYSYRGDIIKLLNSDAESQGYKITVMVMIFNWFRKNEMTVEEYDDLIGYLHYKRCAFDSIPNLMAWYALETVCRWFEE